MEPKDLVPGAKYRSQIQLYDALGNSIIGQCEIIYQNTVDGYPWPAYEFRFAEGYGHIDNLPRVLSAHQVTFLKPVN